VNGEVA